MNFINNNLLTITPLTPIHIGCGEDFDPTNYVIDDNLLFHFEASRASLTPNQKKELLRIVASNTPDLIQIQNFFKENHLTFQAISHAVLPVSGGVAKDYDNKLGRNVQSKEKGRVVNKLEIERHFYNPYSHEPIIPGSSIKGAIRTAFLNEINQGKELAQSKETSDHLQKRLMKGQFSSDPFRLIKVGDTTGSELARKVMYCVNHKKREVKNKDGQLVPAKGVTTRREMLLHAQYRALSLNLSIQDLGYHVTQETPAESLRPTNFAALARSCNDFYLPILRAELQQMNQRQLIDPAWYDSIMQLLNNGLDNALEQGQIMLLRVGRHSGAESMTLNGVRNIKINQAKGMKPTYEKSTKTWWLTANNENARSDMLPLGWLLIESSDAPHQAALQAYCAQYPNNDSAKAKRTLQAIIEANTTKLAQKRQQEHEEQVERENALKAQQEKENAKQNATANMLEVLQFVEKFLEKKLEVQILKYKGMLHSEALKLINKSLENTQTWTATERLFLADKVGQPVIELIHWGKEDKDKKKFANLLRKLSGETL